MPDAPTNQNPPDTGGQQPATPPPATAPASGTQTPPPENPGVINPPQPQQFADGQAFAELKAQNDRLAADLAKERGRIEEIERRARRQTFSEQASDWVTPTKKDELIDFMERLSPEDLQFFMTLMGEHTTQVKKFAELGRLSMQEFDEPEGEPVNDDEIKDLMNMSPMGRAISRNNGQQ